MIKVQLSYYQRSGRFSKSCDFETNLTDFLDIVTLVDLMKYYNKLPYVGNVITYNILIFLPDTINSYLLPINTILTYNEIIKLPEHIILEFDRLRVYFENKEKESNN